MTELASMSPTRVIAAVESAPWDYADADTQQLTHNIHRYSGKFIPQIASRAVSILTEPGQIVLDPYCGSGTTVLEALMLKRRAIGVDLNPLAVLIARTKITPIPREGLSELQRLLGDALSVVHDDQPLFRALRPEVTLDANKDLRLGDEWFQKWFQPTVLRDLVAIEHAIRAVSDVPRRNVALVAFSDILRKSSNAHSGYPNIMFHRDAPPRGLPVRPFLRALDRVCEMVASLADKDVKWDEGEITRGNAAALVLDDASVDAVVTHPPYIGSIPYAEYGYLSLKWLGEDPKKLDRELTGGRRQALDVVERFRTGYGCMLKESARVLRQERYAFLMVGNPIVRGEEVDLASMTVELASEAGFELVVRTERNGVNRRANKMGPEHLLFFVNRAKGRLATARGSGRSQIRTR